MNVSAATSGPKAVKPRKKRNTPTQELTSKITAIDSENCNLKNHLLLLINEYKHLKNAVMFKTNQSFTQTHQGLDLDLLTTESINHGNGATPINPSVSHTTTNSPINSPLPGGSPSALAPTIPMRSKSIGAQPSSAHIILSRNNYFFLDHTNFRKRSFTELTGNYSTPSSADDDMLRFLNDSLIDPEDSEQFQKQPETIEEEESEEPLVSVAKGVFEDDEFMHNDEDDADIDDITSPTSDLSRTSSSPFSDLDIYNSLMTSLTRSTSVSTTEPLVKTNSAFPYHSHNLHQHKVYDIPTDASIDSNAGYKFSFESIDPHNESLMELSNEEYTNVEDLLENGVFN
ncbi:uncharacterized protein KQ657_003721 [Scheffersomyces spartinae]|uniref:Hap4 transcription factor heteromerisation domain-containing protein n=1 Tax=Scheffersomyces spartinae TaxID=45513 RepID=A0A9P8AJV7_9ASCO|nr:uncharacterized protein KQ657_003721 [Scheffersomyces spartinae]KAG7195196.1 hypothetical protein KQ657_003721 [Scheffersomyces spartinae]